MHVPHPPEPEPSREARRSGPVRRSGAVLAGLALVATVPFVARALDTEVTADDRSTAIADPSPEASLPSPEASLPSQEASLPSPEASLPSQAAPTDTSPTDTSPTESRTTAIDTSDRPIPRGPIPGAAPPAATSARTATTAPTTAVGADTDPAEGRPGDPTSLLTADYAWDERSPRVVELQRLLGVTDDGWYGAATRRAHLEALAEAGLSVDAVPDRPGPPAAAWEALRQCEAGGDYSIVSRSGRYRGAYQFDRTTWDSVAGRHAPELVGVDPAAAAPADQDAMALALYDERGAQPWPHCGRHLR